MPQKDPGREVTRVSVPAARMMTMTHAISSPFSEETLDRLFGQDIDPDDYIAYATRGEKGWTGAPCGCLHTGCIGLHHRAGQECPCLFPLMAEFSKSRMLSELREEMQTRKVATALVEERFQGRGEGDLTLSMLAADPDISIFAMLKAVNAAREDIMRADAAEDAADV